MGTIIAVDNLKGGTSKTTLGERVLTFAPRSVAAVEIKARTRAVKGVVHG